MSCGVLIADRLQPVRDSKLLLRLPQLHRKVPAGAGAARVAAAAPVLLAVAAADPAAAGTSLHFCSKSCCCCRPSNQIKVILIIQGDVFRQNDKLKPNDVGKPGLT